ncbi:MAG: hypothetical protein ACOX88_10385 [Christensenellales bacterium]|jgi:hypothetical protein
MSPKELLYMEDALSHQQHLKTLCDSVATQLQDTQLQEFVRNLSSRHQNIFDNLYNTL